MIGITSGYHHVAKLCRICCILSGLLLSNLQPSFTQVLNVEEMRTFQDSLPWEGSLGLKGEMSKSDELFLNTTVTSHVQHLRHKMQFLYLGEFNLNRTGDSTFSENGYLHLRYVSHVKKPLAFECFTQIQYNKALQIKQRFLLGGGLRWHMVKGKKVKMWLGVAAMADDEIYQETPREQYIRNSDYLSLVVSLGKKLIFTSITYYQPVLKDMADYRLLTSNALQYRAGKHFSLGITYSLTFDSKPPAGVESTVYSLKPELLFTF